MFKLSNPISGSGGMYVGGCTNGEEMECGQWYGFLASSCICGAELMK